MTNNLQVITDNYIDTRIIKRIEINGVEFDEEFLAGLVAKHMNQRRNLRKWLAMAGVVPGQNNLKWICVSPMLLMTVS